VVSILTRPPLIVTEVLSPQDSWSRMEERIADYLDFEVRHVRVLEPGSRRAWTITPEGRRELTTVLKIAGSPITVPLDEHWKRR